MEKKTYLIEIRRCSGHKRPVRNVCFAIKQGKYFVIAEETATADMILTSVSNRHKQRFHTLKDADFEISLDLSIEDVRSECEKRRGLHKQEVTKKFEPEKSTQSIRDATERMNNVLEHNRMDNLIKTKQPTAKQKKAASKAIREARLKLQQARELIMMAEEEIVAKVEQAKCEHIHDSYKANHKSKDKRKIRTAPYYYESSKGMTPFARYSGKKSIRPISFGAEIRPEKYSRREILIRSR